MHADGYAGFEDLYRANTIQEVACLAHVRRKFVDVHRAQGSPIADEAVRRIAQLHAVEAEARGSPPDRRVAIRQARAKPIFEALGSGPQPSSTTATPRAWLADMLARLPDHMITRIDELLPWS